MIFRGVAFLEEADALVEELRDLVEDSLEDAAEAGTREPHLIQEDLHDDDRRVRLPAAAAPADGPAGRRRGLSTRWSAGLALRSPLPRRARRPGGVAIGVAVIVYRRADRALRSLRASTSGGSEPRSPASMPRSVPSRSSSPSARSSCS